MAQNENENTTVGPWGGEINLDEIDPVLKENLPKLTPPEGDTEVNPWTHPSD